MDPVTDVRLALDAGLGANDRVGAVATALGAVDQDHMSIDGLYEILSEVLVGLGASWQTGTTEVWQEHAVTAAVRTIAESRRTGIATATSGSPRASSPACTPSTRGRS
jgi:hypothetical protein